MTTMKWRPIEGAPEGMEFLVFVPARIGEDPGPMVVAKLSDGTWYNPHDCEGLPLYYSPSHYMLPEPPGGDDEPS